MSHPMPGFADFAADFCAGWNAHEDMGEISGEEFATLLINKYNEKVTRHNTIVDEVDRLKQWIRKVQWRNHLMIGGNTDDRALKITYEHLDYALTKAGVESPE